MSMEKEALTHKIEDDLAARNRNWDKVTSHLAESVARTIRSSRNKSLTGVQKIDLPFKAKSLIVTSTSNGTLEYSIGFWAENDLQHCLYMHGGVQYRVRNDSIIYLNDGTNASAGVIQNVDETGFEINWSITAGNPTGTAQVYILASTHEGV